MGDQVGQRPFTGFGEVNFVSCPQGRALFAPMGFGIIRRVNEQRGGGKISHFSPAQLLVLNAVVLDPDLAQDLDSRNLPQPDRPL